MEFIDEMITEERERDPAFREAYDREVRVDAAERALVAELVAARKAAGMTQQAVADRMGVKQPYIAAMENFKDPFSLRTAIEYAVIVGATLGTLKPAAVKKPLRPKAKLRGRGHTVAKVILRNLPTEMPGGFKVSADEGTPKLAKAKRNAAGKLLHGELKKVTGRYEIRTDKGENQRNPKGSK